MVLWRGTDSSTAWKTEAKFNFVHIETDEPQVKKRKVQPMVKRNDDAIISEMERLGSGLIDRIEIIKAK